jgi:hypothetical protein
MTTLTFNVTLFRQQFPAFSNSTTYPTVMLQMYWDMATIYVNDEGNYGYLQGIKRQTAINMMTAHLTQISTMVQAGETPGYEQQATVDKVSVSLTPPMAKNQWQWWMNTTPYGAELLALLQMVAVGGFYAGGLPEGSAFRRVGGVFVGD